MKHPLNSHPLYFSLTLQGQPFSPFSVVSFDFIERYNDLYDLDILVATTRYYRLDIESLLEQPVVFKVWQWGEVKRTVSGIIYRIERGEPGTHRCFYRLNIAPDLYRLTLRRRNRIFQQKTIREILQIILKENGIAFYEMVFKDEHPAREYCVQYRETDFEFLQRLTGEEGIIFRCYQHGESQEGVVFFDDWRWLMDKATLPYNPHPTAAAHQHAVNHFKYAHQLCPHFVELRDYTFRNPGWPALYHGEKKDNPTVFNHQYRYDDYPGRYKDGRGEQYAQYRLDSLRREANLGEGQSNAIELEVGMLFKLTDHPIDAFNTFWQPIFIHHHGEQPQALEEDAFGLINKRSGFGKDLPTASESQQATVLTNRFQFIPRQQSYRANFPQKPQISGPQTAIVVGPKGEEIFTDDQGRVKVQFYWDREGTKDDHSSCWIRVASPWAGQDWGMLALPRVGQEVIVSFQEGDADQPIITGRVYNTLQVPPGRLPYSKTQMYIKSKTYKGNGYNSLMFDDATHQELFHMHAERDMETQVKHDQRNHIKNDRTLEVNGSQTTQIDKGRTTQITTGNDIKTVMAGNDLETISLLKSTTAKEIFQYGKDRIELEVGEQTSITLDNEKILLRFGKSTILMNKEGIWLDAVHIGLQEKEIEKENFLNQGIGPYSHSFVLQDKNGNLHRNMPYVITQGNKIFKGISDDEGKTKTIYLNESEQIDIKIDWDKL
ncbi:type VI secretion system tip protein TssI/VgrG [uncultured Actinobacillus sp.]|uniref:type VI secretion system Vgr family protein n=1 Tax=uncultured Actinobacillus sp. TaxID=417616 RepID=UPI0025F2E323|nr:type VI secretion system tip protein TssI/VgrG [uncultured Actinobacillus sp.]